MFAGSPIEAAYTEVAPDPDRFPVLVEKLRALDMAPFAWDVEQLTAPTLLVVGGRDLRVLELNRDAQARIRGETRLEIVTGATHLFEEPGALDRVAELAAAWFTEHVG